MTTPANATLPSNCSRRPIANWSRNWTRNLLSSKQDPQEPVQQLLCLGFASTLTLALVVAATVCHGAGPRPHASPLGDVGRRAQGGGPLAGVSPGLRRLAHDFRQRTGRRKPEATGVRGRHRPRLQECEERASRSRCCLSSARWDRPRRTRRKSAWASAIHGRWATAAKWPSAPAAIGSGTNASNRRTFTANR